MADRIVGFDPYKMKLKHISIVERAFNVKFIPLVKKLERQGDTAMDEMSGNELQALVYIMQSLRGAEPTVDEIGEMSFAELGEIVEGMAVTEPDKVDPT